MIRREKLHALILARRNVGEADRLIMCFTKEHGLLEVRASGVRKIPSRRGGHVEPFTHVLGIISGVPGRLYLAGVETLDTNERLQREPEAFEQAQLFTSYLTQLLPEAEPQPALFDAVYHAWQILPDLSQAKRDLLEVALTLCVLQSVGILPDLVACEECGTTRPNEAIVLDSTIGSWRCLGCHHSFNGSRTSLAPRLFKVLRFIAQYPERALTIAITPEESWQLLEAIRNYIGAVTNRKVPLSRLNTSHFSYGSLAQ